MAIEEPQGKKQVIRYACLAVSLLAMAGILGWMTWITTRPMPDAAEKTRELMRNLAVAATATLAITLIALMGVLLRWFRHSYGLHAKLPETTYVNAWEEAGQRIETPTASDLHPDDEDEDEDGGEDDDYEDEDIT
ncbi:MAG: hypothetical protein K8S55_07615 [Phycisphaerae bacterium]|nr:hypothetical protein [Phycisphaerae bacterium]